MTSWRLEMFQWSLSNTSFLNGDIYIVTKTVFLSGDFNIDLEILESRLHKPSLQFAAISVNNQQESHIKEKLLLIKFAQT